MSINALSTDGRFPVRRKRPNRPSVDNAFRSSWCPHFGVRFTFVEWRYIHERGSTNVDMEFLSKLSKATQDAIAS